MNHTVYLFSIFIQIDGINSITPGANSFFFSGPKPVLLLNVLETVELWARLQTVRVVCLFDIR